ncbi:hypothetical protein [Heyndrickxia acidicola]|uniref:Uncharacterized protein n=1 Tax=Heyndrickxia acidicola TaxID=209389 RepID=A0ABU6MFK3_9BACI|nr:hypothetical protein [Heyndrickxia acidicola]MED1203446.1 hypothetical protein [Heyndrickxia acidicola]
MEQKVLSYCLKGDVLGAYEYLKHAKKGNDMEALFQQYTERFFQHEPVYPYKTSYPWIKEVLKSYFDYFTAVLARKENEVLAEEVLLNRLSNLLADGHFAHLDEAEEALEKKFLEKGLYFLGGVTAPYRGPYIWRRQEKKEYEVILPSGIQRVTVYFMDDFLLHSWLHFATFGKMAAGGWAKREALYCVKKRYEKMLNQPAFLVSFLKHEAQHFKDYQDFPRLGPCDLEYRAKLVELMYDPSTSLLEAFSRQADPAPNNPHAYASFVLLSKLADMLFGHDARGEIIDWAKVDRGGVHSAAGELFGQHTAQLTEKGKDTAVGVI